MSDQTTTIIPPPEPCPYNPIINHKTPVIQLQSDEHTAEFVRQSCLIGKVFTQKPLNRNVVKSILTRAWKAENRVEIRDGDLDTYIFIFADEVLKQKVLNLEPLSVKGQLIVLKQWIPTSLVSELDFTTAPFWVQAHGIPPDMITAEKAFRVAQAIGVPVEKQSSLTHSNQF